MLWSSLELLIRRQLLIVSITCLLLLWSGGFCSAKINYSVNYGSRAMSHIPFLVFEGVLFSKTSQTFLVFEDVFKTSSRRLQDVFSVTLFVFQDVFKTSSRRVCKTSCNYVFKTSWKTKKCYTEDVFKTSSVRLHQDECLLGFNTFLRHFFPQRRLSTKGFAYVTLHLRNLWSVYKIFKTDKIFSSLSFSLYYSF